VFGAPHTAQRQPMWDAEGMVGAPWSDSQQPHTQPPPPPPPPVLPPTELMAGLSFNMVGRGD